MHIACGISGTIQHLTGVSGSDGIVAINKKGNPGALIFGVADYGIMNNIFEMLPVLTAEIKA